MNPAADRTDLVRACLREPVSRTPVWFMRQAGRSLPEYRAARGTGPSCPPSRTPPLSAELTLQPVQRYGVDAAIVFSDIVVPLHAIGFGVEVQAGLGPGGGRAVPQRSRPGAPASIRPGGRRPLRRRDGAPGGAGARGDGRGADRVRRRALHRGQLPRRGRAVAHLRQGQVAHARRSRAVEQLDRAPGRRRGRVACGPRSPPAPRSCSSSTAGPGALSPDEYVRFALPATRAVFEGIADLAVPSILFGVGTGELLALMGTAGSDVVGVDWRVPLDEARRRVGPGHAVQGNLDPALCLAPWPVVADATGACWPAPRTGPAPGTSSTSGTASCPRPTRRSSLRSSSSCTRRPPGVT